MRDVLVRATRLDEWDRAVCGAAALAAGQRAAITAVHALPLGVAPPPDLSGGALVEEYALAVEQGMRESEARATVFAAWAVSLGASHAAWISTAATVADALAFVGNWHDVLVLGLERDGSDPWSEPGGIARIMLGTHLPCLVLPPDAVMPRRCETIAVAWNGSIEAIRAMHGALPLLQQAPRVVMLVGQARPRLGTLPEFSLRDWCGRHLPQATFSPLGGGDHGQAILAATHDAGADLLVLGAYGRSRFSEWVLGGVTRHVLDHARVPLLMRH